MLHHLLLLFLVLLPWPQGTTTPSETQLLVGGGLDEAERNQKIDAVLYYYFNGKTQAAKEAVENLKEAFPEDPFFHELVAEIIWQELEKRVAIPSKPRDNKADHEAVAKNRDLVEQFYKEISFGLALAQSAQKLKPGDVKNIFLQGMLLVRLGGFIAKFERGFKSYSEGDKKTEEGIQLLKKSIELDPSLCSAKYVFALSKYEIIRGASENIFYRLAIQWRSRVYSALGENFNLNDAFTWLREAAGCETSYYYTKDIEIDKKMVYQEILVRQAGRMDEEVLPVLEELNAKFPENKTIQDNLFLVRFRLENKKKRNP